MPARITHIYIYIAVATVRCRILKRRCIQCLTHTHGSTREHTVLNTYTHTHGSTREHANNWASFTCKKRSQETDTESLFA